MAVSKLLQVQSGADGIKDDIAPLLMNLMIYLKSLHKPLLGGYVRQSLTPKFAFDDCLIDFRIQHFHAPIVSYGYN